jgi:hypothetical protein
MYSIGLEEVVVFYKRRSHFDKRRITILIFLVIDEKLEYWLFKPFIISSSNNCISFSFPYT